MKIRKPYNQYRSQTVNTLPSRTKQSDASECEINNIMAKYMRTGAIEHYSTHQGHYSDITGPDFETAMNIVADANTMFAELPSNLRNRFENSPKRFLEFVQDESNLTEMAELGLTNPSPETPDLQSDVQGETASSEADPVAST
jgi:phage internal scaffolding protein